MRCRRGPSGSKRPSPAPLAGPLFSHETRDRLPHPAWVWAKGLGGPVAYYRLYFLDGFTGHIDHFREFHAESDDAAIAYAEDALGSMPMELWCQHRKVMHWDGIRPEPPTK